MAAPWPAARAPVSTGPAQPHLEVPTLAIPCDCECAWAVVREGPGMACVSQLKRMSGCCPHRLRHLRAAADREA